MPLRDILGHRHLTALLSRAIARDSLPPSLILAGPGGVGKLTTAVAVAQTLNCQSPTVPAARQDGTLLDRDACGTCDTCTRIARARAAFDQGEESALDCLRLIGPDDRQSIKVDRVRALIATTSFRPFDGRRRVVVVEEADALEGAAQNALLKTLEEPPSGSVFLLVTSRPDALLPTVRSRCQRLRFGLLSPADVARYLTERAGLPPPSAHAAAALAGGSIGAALTREAEPRLIAREIADRLLRQVAAGHVPARRLQAAQVLLARAEGEGRKAGAAVGRAEVAERLEALATLLRDVQIVSSRADRRWLANADLASDLPTLAAAFDGRRLTRAFDAVDRALVALDRNVSPKTVADWLAFQL
jgi:DNA polymerase III subunit delta'